MAEPCARGDGKAQRIVEPRVDERALAVHLEVRDKRIPVRDAAPPGIGVQVDARQPERRRKQRRRALPVRPERLAVEEQLRVELARPPAVQHGAHGRLIGLQQIGDDAQIRRERDDRADVQIAIGPAVEPAADARRDGVVDGRMAQRALDADRREPAGICPRWPVSPTTAFASSSASVTAGSLRLTRPCLIAFEHVGGKRLRVDLQPDRQRGRRAHAWTDAAEACALDRLVQLERVAPERLVAERVEAENPRPSSSILLGVAANDGIEAVRHSARRRRPGLPGQTEMPGRRPRTCRRCR